VTSKGPLRLCQRDGGCNRQRVALLGRKQKKGDSVKTWEKKGTRGRLGGGKRVEDYIGMKGHKKKEALGGEKNGKMF